MSDNQVVFVGTDQMDYPGQRQLLGTLLPNCTLIHLNDAMALWYYLDEKPLPSLFMLDMDLPDSRDLEVLRTLRSHPRFQAIRTWVYTSVADPVWEQLCRQAGATEVHLKKTVVSN